VPGIGYSLVPPMFTFINTVEVLPTSCVDSIHRILRESGLAVPIVLKAKAGMQGFVALHAWIPLSEPVCRLLPTELVVAKSRATELEHLLGRFVREVQNVARIAQRESANSHETPEPSVHDEVAGNGGEAMPEDAAQPGGVAQAI
jgi:hypothetical protein